MSDFSWQGEGGGIRQIVIKHGKGGGQNMVLYDKWGLRVREKVFFQPQKSGKFASLLFQELFGGREGREKGGKPKSDFGWQGGEEGSRSPLKKIT